MINYLRSKSICKNSKIYLFGVGKIGLRISDSLAIAGVMYTGFLDNAYPNGGIASNGRRIYPISVIDEQKDDIYVIITCADIVEVKKQLESLGVKKLILPNELAMTVPRKYSKIVFKKTDRPCVSVILPVYNGWKYTYEVVKELWKNNNKIEYELIIGDNNSSDATIHAEETFQEVNVLHHTQNLQYLGNVNECIKKARGKYILLLQNDIKFVTDAIIDKMYLKMEADEKIGALSGRYWNPITDIYGGAFAYSRKGEFTCVAPDRCVEADFLSMACTMIRLDLWRKLGGFDENYKPVFFEDWDLFLNLIEMGKKCVYDPNIEFIHYQGVTYGVEDNWKFESAKKNRVYFLNKHKAFFENESLNYNELRKIYDVSKNVCEF